MIKSYIRLWENRCYPGGIPDEVEASINDLVPNYKMICIAIMKNDYALKSLGFTPKFSNYYSELKRLELAQRGVSIQLKLF